VIIRLRSDNLREGRVSTPYLVFTPTNWYQVQSFRVTGQEDGIRDGHQTYHVITTAESFDRRYHRIPVSDVTLRNLDSRRIPGFIVTPVSGLYTGEDGRSATFRVSLTLPPRANVIVPVRSLDLTEGRVSTPYLVFTPTNWNIPQTVTVTGVDDSVYDGHRPYTVALLPALSRDSRYAYKNPADVSLINLENESIAMWNGTYVGSYNGYVIENGRRYLQSGPVRFTVYNFRIYLAVPGAGSGTITTTTNGAAFGSVTTQGYPVWFSGAFYGSGPGRFASGKWSLNSGGVVGSGTWNAHIV
jgi:hypothetical protein